MEAFEHGNFTGEAETLPRGPLDLCVTPRTPLLALCVLISVSPPTLRNYEYILEFYFVVFRGQVLLCCCVLVGKFDECLK